MNLAKQMHILADKCKNNHEDILKKRILDSIKTSAELGLFSLEYKFKSHLSYIQLEMIKLTLEAEGFKVEFLDDNRYIFISWDL